MRSRLKMVLQLQDRVENVCSTVAGLVTRWNIFLAKCTMNPSRTHKTHA
ncbi:MAG: hypothetical protein QXQ81_09435 [Candidatus Thorarchaeota archaeon]